MDPIIKHGLSDSPIPHGPLAKLKQHASTRIFHELQIRGINLGVSAETSEIVIDKGRIQEYGKTVCKSLWQAALVFVEQVQVILKTERFRIAKWTRADHAGHDSTLFFLG